MTNNVWKFAVQIIKHIHLAARHGTMWSAEREPSYHIAASLELKGVQLAAE